jgi:hypothetical protein
VEHELLFELLPEDGLPVSQHEVLSHLGARLGRQCSSAEFEQFIWALGIRITRDPHSGELRRILTTSSLPEEITREKDLEPWFERYLFRQAGDFFEPRPPIINTVVQNTARGAGNEGRFTKPDICMACVSRYHYTPGIWFDLYCFELKLANDFNIPAVMQALANAAFAHFTYLAVYLPEGSTTPRHISAIRTRAIQHGVGIVGISDPMKDEGYQILLPARRHMPRPGDTELFIENRFEDANRNALRNWVRS